MGWMTWGRYRCRTDCVSEPDGCVSSKLIRNTADIIAEQGYRDVGYEYINIDDCWPERSRDAETHKLLPDHERFPEGIKALADYVHGKGLKLGIYGDIGNLTCARYPGFWSEGESNYFQLDAATFAEWTIDSIKVDGCYMDPDRFDQLYPQLGQYLNRSGNQQIQMFSLFIDKLSSANLLAGRERETLIWLFLLTRIAESKPEIGAPLS